MSPDLVLCLRRQNRLLRLGLCGGGLLLATLLLTGAAATRQHFGEIDVERINVVDAQGRPEIILANRTRLPRARLDGKEAGEDRHRPGLIFYNEAGDECGGLIFDGTLDGNGKPASGMHFSMDRFGGDQQLALGHYERQGFMETGLNVYDRGLARDYQPLYEAWRKAPEGPGREALKRRWEEAGGPQVQRLFVGRTRGRSSAVILADAKGRPRIMLLVSPEGEPRLDFLDGQGKVLQSLPAPPR